MSGNYSSRSLMGFSVHQPALGAALQFFPAMGSVQLDEMIDAYIPGRVSILDKRTAVSLEFFDHTLQTGELFKFFLVYPAVGSNTASPASTMQDSGYGSSFNTSPVMNDSLWKQATNEWPFSSSSKKARIASKKTSSSSSSQGKADFSHIPGMKIMTKEGLDVTNSASRGCKTKEQRDHAHLMRIIKACDACKRKKTRCDPSHKKRGSSVAVSPEPKVSKKVKRTTAPSNQKSPAFKADIEFATTLDPTIPDPYFFDANFMTAPDQAMNDWDQYIKYDEDVNDVIPQDYDFFFDPAKYFSPKTTDSSQSASVSSSQILTPSQSQPVTPASGWDIGSGVDLVGPDLVGLGSAAQPTLPYLHRDGGVEVGNNYVDFALYSPGSSCLDDDTPLPQEVAASQGPDSQHYQQVFSGRKPDVRSSLNGGVAKSPQTTQARDLSTLETGHNEFASSGANSLFVQQGLVQTSDQAHADGSHNRDRGSQQPGRYASAVSSYNGLPPNPVEQRVPGATVIPSDTLQGLPPSSGLRDIGAQPGLFPVNGLLAACVAVGIKASVSVHGGNAYTFMLSLLPLLAVLSSFVAVTVCLCYGLSTTWSLVGGSTQSFVSASLLALTPIAISTRSQRHPVSCINKVDPFTQALSAARQMSGSAIDNVKSQIHAAHCGISNFQRMTQVELGNMSRLAHGNGLAPRMGMVY
ncbi:putative Zn(2)-C6 fungal-type domain-containing protein [Seiridium cardinale]|uniref:Zn(2)-C6 fungal-type domain-containing protein n=1 Tax=Seiridium cardinale TaxID=138064 RepID=A0ABR2XUH7_9PEZI